MMPTNTRGRKSHPLAWSLGVIVVPLLLYVLSWGPVKVHYRTPHNVGSMMLFLDGSPGWLKTFYSPIDALCQFGFVQRMAEAYYAWCDRMMH